MAQFEDDKRSGGPGVVGLLVPLATAIGALVVGLLVGGIVGWVVKPAHEVEVKVPRDLTADELMQACLPQVQEKANELASATTKVTVLETDVKAKEARVAELEGEMQKRAQRGADLVKQLEAAKAELADVKAQLATAQQEKAKVEQELQITVAKLEDTQQKLVVQTQMTERAKEDALTNKYERFKDQSQLDICEKGNRKKLGKCKEAVIGYLSTPDIRDKFAHCVRSGQAVPNVLEMTEKSGKLPDFSQWLNQDDKIVKDWYLLLCDPTLPESDGFLNEEHLPGAAAGSENTPPAPAPAPAPAPPP